MQRCWAGDAAARPSFRYISLRMEKWSYKEDGKLNKFIFKELEIRQNENIEREGKLLFISRVNVPLCTKLNLFNIWASCVWILRSDNTNG